MIEDTGVIALEKMECKCLGGNKSEEEVVLKGNKWDYYYILFLRIVQKIFKKRENNIFRAVQLLKLV